MLELQARRKFERRLYSGFFVLLLLGLSALLVKPAWNIFEKSRESRRQLQAAAEEVRRLKERQDELQAQIENLEELAGREKEIVGKFNLVRGGERLAVIFEESADEPRPAAEPPPFWRRLIERISDIMKGR